MKNTKNLMITALCIALGLVLPTAFHVIPNAGSVMLPMHIPVLLCGMICGPVLGLIAGICTPILSSVMTGMPPAAILPGMACELAVYGLVTGLMLQIVKTKNNTINLYVSLITAMIAGRLVSGVLNALIFRAGAYSLQIWVTASFVTALPGILLQLVILPVLVLALQKARLIPSPTTQEA